MKNISKKDARVTAFCIQLDIDNDETLEMLDGMSCKKAVEIIEINIKKYRSMSKKDRNLVLGQ